ncbi:PLP-dependent transferase [Olsenella sp. DSM 107455]|uniref:PLP-dependent transferase n=1 Tax=Thermophilibacter gallinarum TaxID=2779357 RepID=A0ABR9QUM8_9ACTN|nr:PLP-dependent transferase [Thermophilibacter gallinarum]
MGEGHLDIDALSALSSQIGRERWRALSDSAQVVANYLAAHPRVEAVRYPGLKTDPDFPRAANELVGGFGPRVAYLAAGEWRLWEADERDPRDQVMELEALLAG